MKSSPGQLFCFFICISVFYTNNVVVLSEKGVYKMNYAKIDRLIVVKVWKQRFGWAVPFHFPHSFIDNKTIDKRYSTTATLDWLTAQLNERCCKMNANHPLLWQIKYCTLGGFRICFLFVYCRWTSCYCCSGYKYFVSLQCYRCSFMAERWCEHNKGRQTVSTTVLGIFIMTHINHLIWVVYCSWVELTTHAMIDCRCVFIF